MTDEATWLAASVEQLTEPQLRDVLNYLILLNPDAVHNAILYVERKVHEDNEVSERAARVSPPVKRTASADSLDSFHHPPAASSTSSHRSLANSMDKDDNYQYHQNNSSNNNMPSGSRRRPLEDDEFLVPPNVGRAMTKRPTSDTASKDSSQKPNKPKKLKKTMIVLCTNKPATREQASHQDLAMSICKSRGILPYIILGTDPAKLEIRNLLFSLSGIKHYPQFFLRHPVDQSYEFLGDFQTIQAMNDSGTFTSEMLKYKTDRSRSSSPSSLPVEVSYVRTRTVSSPPPPENCVATGGNNIPEHLMHMNQPKSDLEEDESSLGETDLFQPTQQRSTNKATCAPPPKVQEEQNVLEQEQKPQQQQQQTQQTQKEDRHRQQQATDATLPSSITTGQEKQQPSTAAVVPPHLVGLSQPNDTADGNDSLVDDLLNPPRSIPPDRPLCTPDQNSDAQQSQQVPQQHPQQPLVANTMATKPATEQLGENTDAPTKSSPTANPQQLLSPVKQPAPKTAPPSDPRTPKDSVTLKPVRRGSEPISTTSHTFALNNSWRETVTLKPVRRDVGEDSPNVPASPVRRPITSSSGMDQPTTPKASDFARRPSLTSPKSSALTSPKPPSFTSPLPSGQPAWMTILQNQEADESSRPVAPPIISGPLWMQNAQKETPPTNLVPAEPAQPPELVLQRHQQPEATRSTLAPQPQPESSRPPRPPESHVPPVSRSRPGTDNDAPSSGYIPRQGIIEPILEEPADGTEESEPKPEQRRQDHRRRPSITDKFPEGGACYLVYHPVQGELNIHYSEVPIDGAVGVWTSPDIIAFKNAQGLSRSELIGNCASNVTNDRKNYYNGWCQFVKAAKSMDATVTVLDVGLPVDFYVYQDGQSYKVDGKFESSFVDAVACIPKNQEFDMSLRGKKWSKAAKKLGAVAIFKSLKETESSNSVGGGGGSSRDNESFSERSLLQGSVRASNEDSYSEPPTQSWQPAPEQEPEPGPVEFPAPVSETETTFLTPEPSPSVQDQDSAYMAAECGSQLPPVAESPPPPGANPAPEQALSVEVTMAPDDFQEILESPMAAPAGPACYLLYEPDSSGRLVLQYSKVPVENAIGMWVPGPGKKITEFKFKQNLGKSVLIGSCASGVQGRKNYCSGWCQFVRAAKLMNGNVTLWDPTSKGLLVDVWMYNDTNSLGQSTKLSPGVPVNVTKILAVACLPKHTDFYDSLTVDIVKWMADANSIGAASKF